MTGDPGKIGAGVLVFNDSTTKVLKEAFNKTEDLFWKYEMVI